MIFISTNIGHIQTSNIFKLNFIERNEFTVFLLELAEGCSCVYRLEGLVTV